MDSIEHRTTKVRPPRTNEFVERVSRTLLDECFRVQGRQTWHIGVYEIQRAPDTFRRYRNIERSHQGYRLKGRTPSQALREALGIEDPISSPTGGEPAAGNGRLTPIPLAPASGNFETCKCRLKLPVIQEPAVDQSRRGYSGRPHDRSTNMGQRLPSS